MKQLTLDIGLDTEPDFARFLPGANGMALTALQQLQLPSAPVYLFGPKGSGKSHLLSALAAQVRQQGGRCGWFSADTPVPWDFDEGWSLVVIEDCERLDALQQHAAFKLFIEAASFGAQMACSGALPPAQLPLREDLRSRLAWGPAYALSPLPDDAARQALHEAAQRRGLHFSDEVLAYVMTHLARDLGSQMALLDRLDRFSLAHQRQVTVPLLKRMLAEEQGAATAGPSPSLVSELE